MIYRLRRKFIVICFISFLATLLLILVAVFLLSRIQTNRMTDSLADIIAENGGTFPNFDLDGREGILKMPPAINREAPFTTRFFTVSFNHENEIVSVNTKSVSGVMEEDAKQYAIAAVGRGEPRGNIYGYRYKVYDTDVGISVVFINATIVQSLANTLIITAAIVFTGCSLIVLFLIIIISKRVVKPIAEGYEKQKQFVSDANHELKTPLTLILANTDIAESEFGESEWLADIRTEGKRMSVLINQLGTLARMDEQEDAKGGFSRFNLSDTLLDTVSAFYVLIEKKNIQLLTDVASDIRYYGDEMRISQLISILMDNAVKYCSPKGNIKISLALKKRPIIRIENTCDNMNDIRLNRLFDRFYRAEQARTSGGGFGIGLSIAKSIVQGHHGKIEAYNIQNNTICFEVKL